MENRTNPYIGPPPFSKADKDFFFGRDEEKRDLAAIITAHKEVLLYAQSGAGKSSLINAGLMPLLEDQRDIKVLPVVIGLRGLTPDDLKLVGEKQNIFVYNCLKTWMGDKIDPSQIASMTIPSYLQSLRHGEDSQESPQLLLLIFDQFEEYLVQHPDRRKEKEAFFHQVAEALEGNPLLRVLFVIKEEFLAVLDPYADLLPDMLRTRYRLECLQEDGAIEAVENPVNKLRDDKKTDRSYAPGVAKNLVQKLLQSDSSEQEAPVSSEYVEPVQLQVVCTKLWESLNQGETQITEEHLKKLDVNKALTSFYEKSVQAAVAASGVPEEKLRRWFNEGLITSSGTRGMVFRGQETTEGIPNAAIDILDKEKHIIRAESRTSGSWYELTHDRLIEPIRKSNEEWLRKWDIRTAEDNLMRKFRKGIYLGLAAALCLVVVYYLVHSWIEREAALRADHEMVEGKIAKLRTKPYLEQKEQGERVAIEVTSYLWEKQDHKSFERIISVLQGLQDIIPGPRPAKLAVSVETKGRLKSPGKQSSAAKSDEPDESQDRKYPLELIYDPERYPDKDQLQQQWQAIAQGVQSYWGIPVLKRLQLVSDPYLPKGEARLRINMPLDGKSDSNARISKDIILLVPFKQNYLVIAEKDIPERLMGWVTAHQEDWLVKSGKAKYYLVPHWTLPLFKVAKCGTYPQERLIALNLEDILSKQPELVFTPEMVLYLLQYLHARYPETVDEALAARGGVEGLRTDLIELIRLGPLTDLTYILDSLAKYPGVPVKQAVAQVKKDQASTRELFADQSALLLQRPAKAKTSLEAAPGLKIYKRADVSMPVTKRVCRVYLGSELAKQFVTEDGELTPDLLESLDQLRGKFYKRFGFSLLGVRFYEGRPEQPSSFRIEMTNQTEKDNEAKPIEVSPEGALQRLTTELSLRCEAWRTWYLSPEEVQYILDLNLSRGLRDWLEAHYSLTNLKIILRALINPSEAQRAASQDGQTLRYPSWLLGSLTFWGSMGDDSRDAKKMAEYLRLTQVARLSPPPAPLPEGAVNLLVQHGIEDLNKGNYDSAARAFRKAVKINRDLATRTFLALYARQPEVTLEGRLSGIERAWPLPLPGKLADAEQIDIETCYDLEELIEKSGPQISPSRRRLVKLCLLNHYLSRKYKQRVNDLYNQLLSDHSREEWQPDEEYFLGYQTLVAYKQGLIPSASLEQAQALVSNSFKNKKWKGKETADNAFSEILQLVEQGQSHSPREYWGMLEQLVDLSPESFRIPFGLGNHYVNRGQSLEKINRALALFNQAEGNLSRIPMENRSKAQAFFDLNKGYAYFQKIKYGEVEQRRQDFQNTVETLQPLLERIPRDGKGWPERSVIYEILIDAHSWINDFNEAERLNEEGLKKFPKDEVLVENKFSFYLARMNLDQAVGLGQQLSAGPEREKKYVIFHTALAQFLNKNKEFEYNANRFIYTDHPYRDYIRMLFYCYLLAQNRPDDAKELLNERWRTIEKGTWEGRLKKGDPNVWREMLIGYYLGKVDKKEIFDPLKDQSTFERSPLGQVGLFYSEVYSEAYFYDAMLQSVSGDDPATRQQRQLAGLQKVIGAKCYPSLEYRMAACLIKQLGGK